MKQSQALFLTFLLAILLIASYFVGVFQTTAPVVELPKWMLNVNEVRRIEIIEPKKPSLHISKNNDLWQIDTPQAAVADPERIENFLSQLAKVKPKALVSNDPKRFAQFGMDSTARVVILTLKDATKRLVIGNTTPDNKAYYVRLDESNQILRMEGVPSFSSALIDWRSLSLLAISVNDVQKITVESPDEQYSLSLENGKWQINLQDGKTFPADSAAVSQWLDRFKNFRGESYLKSVAPEMVTADKTHRLVIQTKDQQIHELQFRKRTDDVMGTKEGTKEVFLLSLAQLNLNLPAANELAQGSVPTSEQTTDESFIIPPAPVPVSKPNGRVNAITPERRTPPEPTKPKTSERVTTPAAPRNAPAPTRTTAPRVNVPRVNLPTTPVQRPTTNLPQTRTQNTSPTTRTRPPVNANNRQWKVND